MHYPLPYWMDPEIPKEFDIACLRPANLPRGERFETEYDVYDRADCYIVPNLRDPGIAFRIDKCADPNCIMHCLFPICPICGRHYRRFFIGEVLRIYKENSTSGAQTATVYLETFEAGTLSNASIGTAHARFRKQLERSGFGGAIVIGGTEATYRHGTNDWLLHLHLLSLGASVQAWERLENLMSKYESHDPLRRKPVKDHIKQLSYLQKFHTYHRPGTPHGKNPAPAMPLPEDPLCELASWACNHDFPDFTFCFGAQKRHGRLWVRDKLRKAIIVP